MANGAPTCFNAPHNTHVFSDNYYMKAKKTNSSSQETILAVKSDFKTTIVLKNAMKTTS